MTPRVCANCEHVQMVGDGEGNLLAAWCTEPPAWVHVTEARTHWCSRFAMAGEPPFTVPDETIGTDEEGEPSAV